MGYTILAVGAFALVIALWRFIVLFSINGKVKRQLKDETAKDDNPLGRVVNQENTQKPILKPLSYT